MTRGALLVAVLALGACSAPSSYDGLTGGGKTATETKEDATVLAPRPLSPVSVSLIASTRPRLTWELGPTLTGAVVEMARTRDFAKDVKRFDAKGPELVVPEDLALGVWFWRLKGSMPGATGTTTSAIWEMVVRGPAAHGSSSAPTRSMVDMNGDGEPDLLIGALASDEAQGAPIAPPGPSASGAPSTESSVILFYPGDRDRGFLGGASDGFMGMSSTYTGPIAIGGGTDLDGDGFTDFIESGVDADFVQGKFWFQVNITYASTKPDVAFDLERGGQLYLGAPSNALPSVREGADVDGDGYGDALVGLPSAGYVVLGAPLGKQYPAMLPIYPGPADAFGSSRAAFGAFDANGDGLADVAFGIADPYEPSARAFAAAGDRTQRLGEPRMIDTADAKTAIAFAAGDFNGDGVDDMAMTMPVGTSTRVCIWFGDRDKLLVPGPCLAPLAGDQDFGLSLTAVDLEGDGVDELLATAKLGEVDGVRAVRLGADGSLGAAPIGVPGLGVRLTTIWPGRPGRARWAAVASDGSRIGVFEGAELSASLPPPPDISRAFGRGLR